MKQLRKLMGLIITATIVFSLIACGKGKNNDSFTGKSGKDGYIFREYKQDELGTPDKKIDPQKIYNSIEYTPQMFYGRYRMLGGDKGIEKYRKKMDYVDYDTGYSQKLTAIPYRLETGDSCLAHSITYVKEYNWTRAYFQTEKESLQDLICSYEIEGTNITLKPLKTFKVDEANNKITYEFTEYEFTYEFSFCGRDLTLSKDGKSVTMRAGLNVDSDDPYFYVSNYISDSSQPLAGYDHIVMRYDIEDKESYIHFLKNRFGTEDDYHAVAKLEDNGLLTVSLREGKNIKTYQFVYFYCDDDGLILTDGEKTCYYNDSYSNYYKSNLKNFTSEDNTGKIDTLDEAEIKKIAEKKESLIDDLVKEFGSAGIKVNVNAATGELAMDASVLFGGDSAVLTDAGKDFLNKFIGAYTNIVFNDKYKGFVSKTKIEGHTAPVAGSTYESGLPLSEERANAVKNYCLSAESGVKSEYISELTSTMEAVGMSNATPVYDQSGNIDMAASRRVSFRFMVNIG